MQGNRREEAKGAPSRRGLLRGLWVFLGLVAAGELVWVVRSFLRPRPPAASEAAVAERVVSAGSADDFAPGSVTPFPRGRFYLARLDDGGFLAISRTCTHLGCTVPWVQDEARFSCPCHASAFDITGDVLRSPAPRPLDLFPVVVENNIVKVDTGRRIQRTAFRTSQVTYPSEKG